MENLSAIGERIQAKYATPRIVYLAPAGSRQYAIPTAHDLDVLIVVDGDATYPHILVDEETRAHVFLRSRGFIKRLVDGKVSSILNGPTLTGLTAELCDVLRVDFWSEIEKIKAVITADIKETCCSPNLIKVMPTGQTIPTRQCKGLYHPLAFMYKVKNKSFDLSEAQLRELQAAHDRNLSEDTLDELYQFYGL